MNAQIKLVLDTYRQNRIAPVFSMVGDYGAREIRAIITCDGDPHAVPVTAEVTINAKRPDGQKKRFSGAANDDGSVTVPITQWMLELRGGVECTISAVGIGTKLTTTPITLTVLQTPTGEDISPDDPEYDLLAQVLAGEAERVEAEKTRVVNEQTRVDAEAVRAENEAQREANEDVRRANEAARVNAEQNRADTFAGWVGDIGQLGNFSARLTNVESAIYGDLAREVVDDSVAHIKDVPAAAKPYARIDAVGGMTRKCANILPEDTIVNGAYWEVNADGVVYKSVFEGEAILAERISLTPNTTYCVSSSHSTMKWAVWFVDENNRSIGRTEGWLVTNNTFTTPETPCYSLFCSLYSGGVYQNDIMINPGTTALPYEPYFEGLRSAKVESVESVGANMLGGIALANRIKEVNPAASINTTDRTISYQANGIDGKIIFNTFKPDTRYTFIIRGSASAWHANINIKYTDGTISNFQFSVDNVAETLVVVSSAGKSIESFVGAWYEGSTTLYYDDCGIFEGVLTAEDFKPYVKHTLPIPAEVRAKPWYGLGISKEVCNAIRWGEDGSRSGDVRCVVVDMQSLTWSLLNSTAAVAVINDMNVTPVWNVSRLPSKITNMLYDGTLPQFYLFFADGAYTSVDELLADLSGVMLVYELATPTTEDISDILPADNMLPVQAGGTATAANENKDAVPWEITFVVKEEVTE